MEWSSVEPRYMTEKAEIKRDGHTVTAFVWNYTNSRDDAGYLAYVEWRFRDGSHVHVRIPFRDTTYSREEAIAWATATSEDYPIVTFKPYISESDIDRMLEGNER